MDEQRVIRQDPLSWDAGYKAGLFGEATDRAPDGIDSLSWFSGVIEGKAEREQQQALINRKQN